VLFVFLAVEARIGFAPDQTDSENADGRTLAAMAASYGIAKDKEVHDIFGLQTRRTKIPRPAGMAIVSHCGVLAPARTPGEREMFGLCHIAIQTV
jgi:hypothetical protein